MFEFWDGMKMRLLALMAVVMAAASPAATVASTATSGPAAIPAPVTVALTQTSQLPANANNPGQGSRSGGHTITPPTTPLVPQPIDPTPPQPTPQPTPVCGCGGHLPKGYMCPMWCRYLENSN